MAADLAILGRPAITAVSFVVIFAYGPGFRPADFDRARYGVTAHLLRQGRSGCGVLGLDPRPRDSGQCRGQRKLSKRGPAELRRLLYIAAMTAARHPVLKAFHERQRAEGLSPIAAYNVLARKLLRTAWSIVRYDRPFDLLLPDSGPR